ncbi:alpha/beta hydrolase [Streptomyces sp. DSM 44915]|uniref:Alpha/beta hydrolase n=1 Tax=Streptomyces chisholmiae TaxID=3075540 RepID=A0ABU2JVF9_9ACTN|nr:alpha/beta hydrolase [Streptomyces sp. DSM 44915]MDT0268949.1 alpha/beta hydrolase [Streptomyces sp. DSM 44915]
MTRIATGEITTHVQRLAAHRAPDAAGEPPLVVFVHGLLTDSLASYYFTLGPAFARAGVDVLMYDLRGHGRSERPRSGYRLEHFVGDLAGLLDALGEHRPAHVVGNSFGGTVATALAAWHPERVATATMIESEPPVAEWANHMADGLADARARLVHDEAIAWIAAHHGAHTARLSRSAARILASTTLADDVPASRVIDDGLAEIRCPVLAVFGDQSGLAAQVPTLRAALPDCRTVVLPDQGHSVLVERPEETRALVLDWVLSHRPAEVRR